MKNRFSTADIRATVKELQRFLGLRVVNVYDVDSKTYLFKLSKPDAKAVILVESAVRIHATDFDWPKNPAPSGFSMKLRKHIKGRRLEKIEQLGVDRIVDLKFGSDEAAYHVIIELYDRGNILLTDHFYSILTLLRPRTDESQDVKFAVREVYPVSAAKQHSVPSKESLTDVISASSEGSVLKRILMTNLAFGPALIEHCLGNVGLKETTKVSPEFIQSKDMDLLTQAMQEAEEIFQQLATLNLTGYIIQKAEKRIHKSENEADDLLTYHEYHPWLFNQHRDCPYLQFDSFSQAVDEFYSKLEGQKFDMKVVQQEKAAMKKLENVRKDHEKRIEELQKEQDLDIRKGELIELNRTMVDKAITVVRSAIASQMDWAEIKSIVEEAQVNGDEVARSIKDLKLEINHITLALRDPYEPLVNEDGGKLKVKPIKVDIDLGLGAYANSRRYFDKKKMAAKKEQKTVESSSKALKSAEKKTQQTLKDVATAASIHKARKTFWFEKFLWFISSENYLVISGRDQQQNELIVKRYLNTGDVYVHADLHGAASVIVKNHTAGDIPPKTLNEAGTMAICHSAAWEAKVVTSAWYVYHNQVSKTAPTGEYLTTGSFMIRGKKNYLPPSYLIYGFAILFKLEDDSVSRHLGERRTRTLDELSIAESDPGTTDDNHVELEDIISGDESETETADQTETAANVQQTAPASISEINLVDSKSSPKPGSAPPEILPSGDFLDLTNGINKQINLNGAQHLRYSELNVQQNDRLPNEQSNSVLLDNSHDSVGALIDHARTGTVSPCEMTLMNVNCDIDQGDGLSNEKSAIVETPTHPKNESSLHHTTTVISLPGADWPPEFDETVELNAEHEAVMPISTEPPPDPNMIDFPDTSIVFDHVPGDKLSLRISKTTSVIPEANSIQTTTDETSSVHKHPARLSAYQRRQMKKKSKPGGDPVVMENNSEILEKAAEKHSNSKEIPQQNLKRGQKAKLKKIKEKYGDEDEEERELRMELLASAGAQKEKKKKNKTHIKQSQQNVKKVKNRGIEGMVLYDENELPEEIVATEIGDEDDQQNEEKFTDHQAVINSLTGIPTSEDELLFAVPVCAPYQALQNYKFKVKLLPGSTKRGRATKTAMAMFLRDKTTSARERDLMKILKDEDLPRNVPGKVKVTAPNLQKHKT